MKVQESAITKSSSNKGHLGWKPSKIKGFQPFLYFCDVNMMSKIEPVTFPTQK